MLGFGVDSCTESLLRERIVEFRGTVSDDDSILFSGSTLESEFLLGSGCRVDNGSRLVSVQRLNEVFDGAVFVTGCVGVMSSLRMYSVSIFGN